MGSRFSVDVDFVDAGLLILSPSGPGFLAHQGLFCSLCRPSMSGLHLVKRGRELKKVDLHRDFTVASPAEFVTRFGGDRVIEKVQMGSQQSGWGGAPLPSWKRENRLQAHGHAAEKGPGHPSVST